MTDREDLDDQIWRTFVGCGVADEKTPRASSGKELEELLQRESPLHLQPDPQVQSGRAPRPYSERDDIIVISDEAHRTQAGKFARNMRLALPNAAFIGFTGTPLFKHDELTRRIFGDYVSRYDFKRSEEDESTVKLVYENRGEKLGIARLDLNDRIADEDRGGRPRPGSDGAARKAARQGLRGHHRRRPAGQDRRRFRRALLDALGVRQVDVRLHRQDHLRADVPADHAALAGQARRAEAADPECRKRSWRLRRMPMCGSDATRDLESLRGQAHWMESTIIEIIISEAQNEVARLQEVGLRHHPAPRADEDRASRRRTASGSMSRTPSRTRSIRSAWRSSAPCG